MGKNLGTFTEASVSDEIDVNNQRTHKFTIIASDVSSVTVRVEFSNDGITYYNVTDYDYSITADDTYNLIVTDVFPCNNLKFRYVSGTGTLKVYYTNY